MLEDNFENYDAIMQRVIFLEQSVYLISDYQILITINSIAQYIVTIRQSLKSIKIISVDLMSFRHQTAQLL
jgi:hypothetical protein